LIQVLKHTEIDRAQWDNCIRNAIFETIYPYSWYLDLVSPGWDALVLNDYDAVMPLTWTRKLGIRLLLQPILAQQLGVFCRTRPGSDMMKDFIQNIPAGFRYTDICLNKENVDIPGSCKSYEMHNYELDLSNPEDTYHTNTRRNIQKGLVQDLEFREISVRDYLDLKFLGTVDIKPVVKRDYLEYLFDGLNNQGRAGVYGLFKGTDLQAAAILGYAETRIIYLNGCSTIAGKENRAMFVLMDHLIRQSRQADKVFDFEGSNIPGVARFFEGFGGKRTIYRRIVRKGLPFIGKIR
jgi:hypothetical protein